MVSNLTMTGQKMEMYLKPLQERDLIYVPYTYRETLYSKRTNGEKHQ